MGVCFDVTGIGVYEGPEGTYAVMILCQRSEAIGNALNGWKDAKHRDGTLVGPREKAINGSVSRPVYVGDDETTPYQSPTDEENDR